MDGPYGSETFIIFSTAKGRTASDGEGRNSRFTTALLRALEEPERRLDDLVYSINMAVRQDSEGLQIPWINNSLMRPVYLVPAGEAAAPPVEPVPEPEPLRPKIDLVVDGDAENPVIALETDFLPDPFRQAMRAGGRIDASAVSAECRGFISSRPTAIVDYEAGKYPLYIHAASAADTTLLVHDPRGKLVCSDDVDGLNPYLQFEDPASGAYRIWIGANTGSAGETVDAELRVSEHGLVIDGGALNPEIALASGFGPDPMTLDVRAGGSVNIKMADEACRGYTGYIARWPDFVIDFDAGERPLHVSVASDADTVLAVRDPSGAWSCNDDHGPESLNAAVSFAEPRSGRYRVWVGTYGSDGDAPEAKLYLSEQDEPHF
jgi:hypothetical protein